MKTNLHFICLIFTVFFSCAQNNTNIESPKSVSIHNKKLITLDKALHQYVDDGKLAGIQTAILHKNVLIHYDSYGYADIERKTSLNEQSIFRIFSMTKPITSVGLMMLFEQGKFKLNDPIHLYIPEFKNMKVLDENNEIVPAKNTITIIDLLRHSSGMSYGRSYNQILNNLYAKENLGNANDLKDFINRISKLPLLFEPGTAYEYGHSTNVCGYLIEILSGQSLNEYLKEKILNPLKMNDTYFQLPKEKVPYLTTSYRATQNNALEVLELPEQSIYANKVTFYRAGGGLVSTTNDYLNFCRMLLNKGTLFDHQILKQETIDLMLKDHLEPVRKLTPRLRILPRETGFGLGFSIANQDDGRIIYGWGGAVGTYFRIDPKHNLAYIMMIQLSPYRQLNLRETFQGLVNDAMINRPNQQNIIKPILLDKSMLSEKGLKAIKLKDQPNRDFFQNQIYKGKEISAYVISSSTASKDFENFSIDEFVYLTNGSMTFKPKNNETMKFDAGDLIVIPKGYNGNIKTIGNPKYHLELSIVSNKRADKALASKMPLPFVLNKYLTLNRTVKLLHHDVYEKVVYSGAELEIIFTTEKPRLVNIKNNLKEQCIQVLEGQVKITPENSTTQLFNTGDFFILPKGFKGSWESESEDIFQSISIKTTN